jgi:hypothetical protein
MLCYRCLYSVGKLYCIYTCTWYACMYNSESIIQHFRSRTSVMRTLYFTKVLFVTSYSFHVLVRNKSQTSNTEITNNLANIRIRSISANSIVVICLLYMYSDCYSIYLFYNGYMIDYVSVICLGIRPCVSGIKTGK